VGGHLALHIAIACPGRVAGLLLIDPLGAVGDGGAADVGRALGQRLLPAAISRYQEVAARLSGPGASDADMLDSLRLLWPGYYAHPQSAPRMPPGMRASLAGYTTTFASVAEHLAGGSFARALSGARCLPSSCSARRARCRSARESRRRSCCRHPR
jgi:pimeloyl-ACP methyl ester carboxylesterase